MKRHLNTLYVVGQGASLRKKGQNVEVRLEGEVKMRVPAHHLNGIVCFGATSCSTALLGFCGEKGVSVSFLTRSGRFLARSHGFTPGNVLLRREQYRVADDQERTLLLAQHFVFAKIRNCRNLLQRRLRELKEPRVRLTDAAGQLKRCAAGALSARSMDTLRGSEGEAASHYFSVFQDLISEKESEFSFSSRSRRPPRDEVNALLSFVYSLLCHDVRSALEANGLDPAVGFLHRDRPGRPSLALDLMEELRPVVADRVVLTVINRRQVRRQGFRSSPGGAIEMNQDTRNTVLGVYQARKDQEVTHPFLGETMTFGLVPHIQARLLARYLRGDLDGYAPFLWK